MAILIFLVLHWYLALFFQSFFHHRYAAHRNCSMSPAMEKVFHVCCFLTQGSSYISAASYGIMHRIHHAHTDTDEDPHSPHITPNPFAMLWYTRNSYFNIYIGKTAVAEKYKKNLPHWEAFDRIAHTPYARIAWALVYIALYWWLATAWWQWLFLPLTMTMSATQGMIVNWWAHKFGYETFKMKNTSKNILPLDVLFVGEAYHNNHHKHPTRANNAMKWYELDLTYLIMKGMHAVGLIQLRGTKKYQPAMAVAQTAEKQQAPEEAVW